MLDCKWYLWKLNTKFYYLGTLFQTSIKYASVSAARTRISAVSSFLQLLKENREYSKLITAIYTPDQTGEDTKSDDTLDLPGTTKAIEGCKHSRSRQLSGAWVLSPSVMNNLTKNQSVTR